MAEVALRLVDDSDLDALFEQMRDRVGPDGRLHRQGYDDPTAFDVHMAKVRTAPEVTNA